MNITVMRKGEAVPVKIDPETLERLQGKSISISSNGYCQIYMDGRVQSLHRWLLGLGLGDRRIADHINRDKLDNRLSNLRVVTPTGSNMNRVVEVSQFGRGVHPRPSGRYGAKVQRNRVMLQLGTYDTPEAAREAVKKFEAGPMTPLRAWEFRQAAPHAHSDAGRLKCRRCNP
jgi:HNH endonuclease